MRFNNLAAALAAALTLATASLSTACLGSSGSGRMASGTGSNGSNGSASPTGDGDCTEVDQDVVIKAAADMATLPKTGCYDLFGKLTIQGSAITSLAGLNGLNSVNELELDSTALTAIDTKGDVGIYGKLTVNNNPKLTSLDKLAFVTAPTGISITSNPALTSVAAFDLDDPKLTEVDGDVAITGNTVLPTAGFKYLTSVTGSLAISNNPKLTSIDLGALTTTGGSLTISGNAALPTLGAMSALYRVSGNLTIDSNTVLTNLAAFTTSLKFVDAMLAVTNNAALTDLGSLKHLSLVGAITITNNQDLLACRATEIDRCTQHPITSVINNNKSSNCAAQCN